ncbi:PREDICTED: mucin-15 [Gekko japonicus]|uniref:Mucin-15 n=1 Tax=Gekko japonicus TaxID=146911 RepID=A0ABM1LF96_GEKJA|nr:PREDICTED: mucin-15 [Gekko japonicus]
MLIFQRMVFILLLASLQWTRCNAENSTDFPSTLSNSAKTSTYTSEPSTTIGTSMMSFVTSPTVTHHNETSTVTEYDTQSNGISLRETGLSQTTQQLDNSTEDTTQTFTSENRMSSSSETSSPSEITTTSSSLLTVSESYANTTHTNSSEAASNSFTTTTHHVSFTTVVSTSDAQTAPPNNTTSAMSLTTSNNAKTVLRTSVQTTRLHPSFTKSSAETQHEPRKDNHSNGGVIFGAIVGAVLGSALIGLVGYFVCRKRKSDGFVHQRLYDDTRNDPVLRLDNAPDSHGESFADPSYYNPTTANETTGQNRNTPPYDAIPMDDMTLSPHLP